MHILVAPDKFRGSLEAEEVCRAAREGILLAHPAAEVTTVPLADGGEGTTTVLTQNAGGRLVTVQVSDPLGRPISAEYGLSADSTTAYMEMAAASGLRLLAPQEYNPLLTSTYGTGELIKDALNRGVSTIILGIGGSATTDGGIGMAAALGYIFLNGTGKVLPPVGKSMEAIASIDTSRVDPLLRQVSIVVACDVTNPLYGEKGAACIYGPQKGANPQMVQQLDAGLRNLAQVATSTFGKDVSSTPGAGAAGGVGAGALWFLNATLREGVQIVMEQTRLAEQVEKADLVITGEGKVDHQTLSGKLVKGLADLCQEKEVPLAVVCGTLLISPEEAREAGIAYAVSILNRPQRLQEAQSEAYVRVREATFHLVRLFYLGRKSGRSLH
ncbi:glycerate kinase [Telluribacter sp. SYSU D00476]|uniref:glycerate kinase n=1 Tax=Telluribacter sp. SYSU D00476 TaxID=2811430 RepID=UPI001FF6F6EF|nr:glycerate kinase [Telluribacter sp. SYSU D00476]